MIDNIQHALAEDFWEQRLKDKTIVSETPVDTLFYTTGVTLTEKELAYFSKLTAGRYISAYTIALTIYAVLLKRYFPHGGSTIFSVDHFEREGHQTGNALLFELPLTGETTLKQFLQQVKIEVQQVYNYVTYDPVALERRMDSRRFEDMTPFGLLYTTSGTFHAARNNFQLQLHQQESGAITADITFAAAFTEKHVVEHLLDNFRNWLYNLEAYMDMPVHRIPLLSQESYHTIIHEFNNTQCLFPESKTITDMFEARVVADPAAIAVVYGDKSMSYGELNAAANQLANYLRAHYTIQPDEVIGVLLPKSDRALVTILAILKTGAAWLPIDPLYPAERIQYIIHNSNLQLLICESAELSIGDNVSIVDLHQLPVSANDSNPGVPVLPTQLAYVIYTSGSTGQPKGVMIEHRSSVNMSVDQIRTFNITSQDKVVWFASVSFDASVSEIMMALYSGATLLIPEEPVLKDRKAFAAFLRHHQATVVTFPPSYLDLLEDSDLAGIRCIISAGEAAHAARAVALSAALCYYNAYGPTECAVCVSTYAVTPADAHYTAIPVGRPIANLAVYILDDYLQPVPVGVEGKLFVSGIGVARGYLNNPALTAQKFVPDVFMPGATMYDTGDIAKWLPDGNIAFIGRKDEQVKLRGYRIELGEIEQAMLALPIGILQVAVTLKEVNQEKNLAAYYVTDKPISRATLRDALAKVLPAYMLPAFFVPLPVLPVTPNGKTDRKALPDIGREDVIRRLYVAPRNSLEQALVNIWQEVLGIDEIGITDDFFELGGNSLLLNRVAAALRSDLGADVPVKELFAATTITDLGKYISERKDKRVATGMMLQERPALLPLSFSQERLWLIDRIEGSLHYHLPVVVKLAGPLETARLEQAFTALISRHEVLRSGIREEAENAYQFILPPAPFHLRVMAGGNVTEADFIDSLVRPAFDLASGALLRAGLLQQGPADYLLVLVMHHLIADGWSMPILVRELMAYYEAASEGRLPVLPELKIQYADYALWQRTDMSGEALAAKLQYWETQLEGLTPLEMPVDFPRPAIRSTRGSEHTFTIDTALTRQLEELSRQEGVTLFMLLLGVFKVLLYKYTGQQDISIGTPVANRGQKEIAHLIGFFVNTLVLRTDLSGDPVFSELLQQVKQTALDAYAHQDVPFEKIVDRVAVERRLDQTPLFQVLFAWQNNERITATRIGDVQFSVVPYEHGVARFDLSVNVTEQEGRLEVRIQYGSDLFLPSTILSLATHFHTLLAAVVAAPDQRVSGLSLLTAEEEQWWRKGSIPAKVNYPREQHFTALFDAQAQRTPNMPAAVFEGRSLTFREVQQRADQLAGCLAAAGVVKGDLVLLCLDGALEHTVTAILGILKAGAAYVPVDPDYPRERITYLLQDTKANVALTNTSCAALKEEDGLRLIYVDTTDDWSSYQRPAVQHTADDLLYVIYTSGSTGQSKGVLITSGNVVDYVYGLFTHTPIQACRSFGLMSTIATDLGNTVLFSALLGGGALHLFTRNQLSAAVYLHTYFRENEVDCIKIVPSLWRSLETDGQLLLPGRMIVFGGEVLTGRELEVLRAARPELEVINHYGPTETTIGKLLFRTDPQENYALVPIGKPFSHTVIYIVDRDMGLCPAGVSGELLIGGDGVGKGYLNRPGLTAEKFIANHFDPSGKGRLYRTGDRVIRLADGNIRFIGRVDDQVKIRGYRVEPAEVTTIMNNSGLVQQGIVVAKEDGAGHKRLIAYVVPGVDYDQEQLFSYLKAQLPAYMVPAAIMELPALPLTSNGKVYQQALPAPDFAARAAQGYVAPTDETARILADIWQELLQVPRVGIYDNFFELGGDSIISIQAVSRANRRGLHLQPQHIFECQTIAALSRKLREQQVLIMGEQGILKGSAALSPIQQAFLDLDYDGRSHYNQSQLLTISKKIPASRIAEVMGMLMKQHDALRFTYHSDNNGWQQVYGDHTETFEEEDLEEVAPGQLAENIAAVCQRYQESLDISRGILVKAVLLRMPASESHHRLFIVIHHLAVDGVSWRLLLEQLNSSLQQLLAGKALLPVSKSNSYREWTAALTRYAAHPHMTEQLPYWQSVIRAYTALPAGISGSDHLVSTAAERRHCRVELDRALTASLLHDSHHAYGTDINDLLLSALACTLQEKMGMPRVVIGLEGHGREAIPGIADITGTVGWFTSIYPVLLELPEHPGPLDLICSVKEQLRRIPQKGIGYGLLKYLHPAADIREQLAGVHWDLVFNYLGQQDNVVPADAVIGAATDNSGANIGASYPFTRKLDVNSIIRDGKLVVDWGYAATQYHADTITALADSFIQHLTKLITHCRECTVTSFTPADFGLAPDLSYQELHGYLQAHQEAGITAIYPLSTLQQGMLFHHLYQDNGKAYKEQLRLDFPEGLQVEAFTAAWRYLLQQHTILRSSIVTTAFRIPVQCVHEKTALPLEIIDHSQLAATEREAAFIAFLEADLQRPFHIHAAPLMRITLVKQDTSAYRMVWTHHHMIADGWSNAVLVAEFLQVYHAFVQGRQPDFSPVDHYADYLRYVDGTDKQAAAEFWKSYMHGFTGNTFLPFTRPVPEQARNKTDAPIAHQYLQIAPEVIRVVRQYCQQHQITVNTLVQGVWALLLSRYTGNRDINFGVVVSGRPADLPEAERRVGLYINNLPLRCTVEEEEETAMWLQHLQQQHQQARVYQYTGLHEIKRLTGARGELFDSILVFENYPDLLTAETAGVLKIENIVVAEQTNYLLTIMAVERGDHLHFDFSYNSDLLTSHYVEMISSHFEQALTQMATAGHQLLKDIDMVSAAEKQLLTDAFNHTVRPYPRQKTIIDLFEEQVAVTPDKTAIVFEEQSLTYRRLDEAADRLGYYLQQQGIGTGDLVAVCMERSQDMMIALLGIQKAGAAYVPVDPDYPVARINYLLEDTAVGIVVMDHDSRQKVSLPEGVKGVTVQEADEALAGIVVSRPARHLTEADPAYVIYTSGSTGRPKGVINAHAGVVNRLLWAQEYFQLTGADVILQKTTFSFDVSVWELFWPLIAGASIVFARPGGHKDSAYLKAAIDQYQVTTIHFVPSMLGAFLPDIQTGDCASLKRVLCSGEALKQNHIQLFREKLPQVPLYNLYGPTEAAVDVTCWEVPLTLAETDPVLIGKPVANTALYILDPLGRLQPAGVTGELYIGGIQVALGYLNRPELTAERFVADRFNTIGKTRLYKTGDLARWLPDGNIAYLGRVDEQIKLRGYRIELGEIIAVLNSYPGIAGGTVLLKEDTADNKRLVAYIVPTATDWDREALTAFLYARLPEYMVPSLFIPIPTLPLTPNGKVDHAALPEPETVHLTTREYVAPRNATEALLADIWQDLLHVPRVGIYDNFFELGGDSIISIQVVSRVARAQLTLRPQDIFEHQTIAGLAHRLLDNAPAASQERLTGVAPLLPIQQWFLETPYNTPAHFNQSHLLKVDKNIDAAHLAAAVAALVTHHDALRFRYKRQPNGTWIQEYGEAAGQLHIVDLRQETTADLPARIREVTDQYQQRMDLAAGELIQVVLLQLPEYSTHHRLFIAVHHLAVDGVSWRILLEHLQTALTALQQGLPIPVWTKGSTYRDWGHALQAYAQRSDVVARQSYWKAVGAAYLPLSADHAPGAVCTAATRRTFTTKLDKTATRSLLQEVNQAYTTEINDLLLAALARTMCEVNRMEQTVVGVEGHGREYLSATDVSNGVGWFTSLYPVVLQTTADTTVGNLISSIKEQLRQVPGKGLEYGLLRYLHPDAGIRAAMAAVRWDILFNYLGQADNVLDETALLQPAPEDSGASVDVSYPLPVMLSISCVVKEGQLQVTWSYSTQQYLPATVETLAHTYTQCLLQLIEHSRQQPHRTYTPTDFGLAPEVGYAALQTYLAANRSVTEIYRLSALQRAMLFHYLYEDSASYREQIQFDLPEGIDIPAFKTSWDVLFKQHSVLRSSFLTDQFNLPVQCVHDQVSCPLACLDFSALTGVEQEEKLAAFLQADFAQGFDLEVPPLMRITLIKMGARAYKMIWTYYHIILDGWSNAVLMAELLSIYAACLKGQSLPVLQEDKYSDYLRYMARTDLYEAELHWKKYLQGFSGKTLLPFAAHVPEQLRNKGAGDTGHTFLLIPEDRTEQIRQYCRKQQITVNTLIQGVWALLLGRYTGRQDVIFGVVVSGRPAELEAAEQRVGLYINNVPLHTVITPEEPVAAWLRSIQQGQTDMRQYQYTTITDIQRWLQEQGELFDSVVVFDNYPKAEYDETQHALKVSGMHIEEHRNYLLSLSVNLTAALQVDFAYNTALLPAVQVQRIRDHFEGVINLLLEQADICLKEVGIVTPAEAQLLLQDFNDTEKDYPADKTIVDIFEAQVAKTPDNIAVVLQETVLTYRELQERSDRLAWYLRTQVGLKAGDLAGVMMERSVWQVVAVLGILKAGAAYVPIDINYPEDRKRYIVEDTALRTLLIESASIFDVLEWKVPIISLDIQYDSFEMPADYQQDYTIAPSDTAYVIYTSGSTGKPKGVMIAHTSNVNMSLDQIGQFGITADDRVLQFASFSFDASVSEIFMALYCGAGLVLIPDAVIADTGSFLEYLTGHGVTVATLPPLYLHTLDRDRFSFMRVIITAGEAAVPADALYYAGKGSYFNAYGPTECAVCVSIYQVQPADAADQPIPVGKPLANMKAYVLDDQLQLLPVGVPGHLYASGVGVAKGYLNRPELTAEKFIPDPFSKKAGSRMYKTGDIACWLPDGNLQFGGRADDQVKIRGYRIEPDEITLVLNECTLVQQAAVIAREDAAGHKRLIAYVVPRGEYDREAILTWLKDRLPEYMIPALMVSLPALPLTINGKVDRKNLPDPDVTTLTTHAYVAPVNEVEQQLAGIWEQLLHVGQIGVNDNFFDLGGDSIISIQVVSRANKLGLRLHPQDIFEYPTIRSLAGRIAQAAQGAQAEQGLLTGAARLLPIQRWFLETPYDQRSHYNQSQLLAIDKKIQGSQLEAAWQALQEQHDALRFSFVEQEGNWIQQYDNTRAAFEIVQLGGDTPAALAAEINTICQAAQQSLQLQEGPLLKAVLLQTPDTEAHNRLFLVIHHLAVDGVSWRILLEHLRIFITEGKAGMGRKTTSFRQWADALYDYAQDVAVTRQLPFWQQVTAACAPIPVEQAHHTGKAGERTTWTTTLDQEVTRSLLTVANNTYHTEINDLLLSALTVTLQQHFDREQWVIGLEGHGREYLSHDIDLSNTVGWFTSVYPVLLTVERDSTVADWISGVKEQLRAVPQKGIGYGLLRYLHPDTAVNEQLAGGSWDVLFNYLGQADNVLEGHPFLYPATEKPGENVGASWAYSTKLDINSMVAGGQLVLNWSYVPQHFSEAVITQLATAFISNLTHIITHCCQTSKKIFTPSDYGLAPEVGHRELARFLAAAGRERITDLYRLSPLQKGMLFHYLYDSSGQAYVEQLQVELPDALDIPAFQLAWAYLLEHHTILRSGFVADELLVPVQYVQDRVELPFEVLDYTALPAPAQQAAIAGFLEADRRRGFDFKKPPLMRITLIQTAASCYTMVWTHHHIILDGWSNAALIGTFLKAYAAYTTGKTPASREEDQYADYIRYIGKMGIYEAESFWKSYMSGFHEKTLLPFAGNIPEADRNKGDGKAAHLSLDITPELALEIRQYCQQGQVTVNTLVQGIWAVLLGRYTGKQQVCFGAVVSGRPSDLPDTEQRVGLYINNLPLHIMLDEQADMLAWMRKIQQEHTAARRYQYTALNEIQSWIGVQGDLFDSIIIFENYPKIVQTPGAPSLQTGEITLKEQNNYLFSILVQEQEQSLRFDFSYNGSLLPHSYAAMIRGHFEQVLLQLIRQPAVTMAGVSLLTTAETNQLLHTFNDTLTDYPKESTVVSQFIAQAVRTPDLPALVFEETTLSYRELDERSNQLAHLLRHKGIEEGALVAVCVERCVEMMVALLGILKTGAAYIPVDPLYPVDRISYMLEDADVRCILVKENTRAIVPAGDIHMLISLDDAAVVTQLAEQATTLPAVTVPAAALAYVIYTSGSTGRPKGVMISHGNLVNFFAGLDQRFPATDQQSTWLAVTSISFDISGLELFWTLCRGNRVVLLPDRPVQVKAAARMDFGLFYFAAQEAVTTENKYKLLLEGAKFADHYGLSSVWIPERHFHSFGDQFPNPAVAAAAVAAVTRHIRIRSGSVVLPLHDPIRVAEEWSMVDHLSEGRVEMSVASGWHPNDFVFAPADHPQRHQQMREKLDAVIRLWEGKPYMRMNGAGKEVNIAIHPKPVQASLPVWVTAAGSEETFRYAGSIGANVLTHLLGKTKEELKDKIAIYRQSLAEHGFDPEKGRVALMLHTFVGTSLPQVEAVVKEPFKQYLSQSLDLLRPVVDQAGLDLERDLDTILDIGFQRYFSTSGLFGTPETCMARIQELSGIGVNEIACLIDFGIDTSTTLAHLPQLKKLQDLVKQTAAQQALMTARLGTAWAPEELISRHEVTHMQCTPSFAHELLVTAAGQQALQQLDTLLIGGEALPAPLVKDLLQYYRHPLYNMYGPTETTIWSAIKEVTSHEDISIGTPIANTQLYVLDEQLALLPIGVAGELYIGGDGVARGYLNRNELTAERFIDNPFLPGEKIYRTGDLARWRQDGDMECLGRIDDQVKISGHRIETGEIETIMREWPGIIQCVVAPKQDAAGQKQLVGYMVTGGADIRKEALRDYLKAKLPAYMVPAWLMVLEQLPLTPNGKVDRRALPGITGEQLAGSYVAPRNPIEEKLANIWRSLLQRTQISVTDSFFELGGNSLRGIQTIAAIGNEMKITITVKDLFENPSVEKLAVLLAAREESSRNQLKPAPVTNYYPLTAIQKAFWLASQQTAVSLTYNTTVALQLTGQLDTEKLAAALQWLLLRHDILGAVIGYDEQGEPVFIPGKATAVTHMLHFIDRQDHPAGAQEIASLFEQERTRAFDFSSEALLRCTLIRNSETQYFIFFNIHHIISDPISLQLVFKGLMEVYETLLQSADVSQLPAPAFTFRDYAWAMQEQAADRQQAAEFWQQYLSGRTALIKLPGRLPDGGGSHQAGMVQLQVTDPQQLEAIRLYNRQQQSTLFVWLMSLVKSLLYIETGQEDLSFGCPINTRDRQELETMIGLFLNTVIIRTVIDRQPDFQAIYRRVKTASVNALAHSHFSFLEVANLESRDGSGEGGSFNVGFNLNPTQLIEDVQYKSLAFKALEAAEQTIKADWWFDIAEHADALHIRISYRKDSFDETYMTELADKLRYLMAAVISAPHTSLQVIKEQITTAVAEEKAQQMKALKNQNLRKLRKKLD
ncbi:non-ribosomal peptide synthase/polyketide synthase [Chitinophaga flava]|uniref:Carrier domain-containing protein n=1 Tax=Chitinophaga flava TaxID=2259036 RepID=A0A365XZQ6_9BACT|nr:non-ribosomal peptide synthase/polyketide synthase [Chitinophaga flava]RBL91045.1 hypothetical protein DF182_00015 [Chitinophaga flava]